MELNVGAFGPSRSGGDGGEHATAAAEGRGRFVACFQIPGKCWPAC